MLGNRDKRLDSNYYSKNALAADSILKSHKWEYLEECTNEISSYGAYDLTNYFSYVEEGIPYLRCLNIKGGFVELDNTLYIDQAANELLYKSEVKPEMVLLTMSGSVGNASVALPSWAYPINSNQDIAKITADPNLNPYYLSAYLGSKFGVAQMERLPVGSIQQHIFLWMIEKLVIARLSPETEKAIGEVVQKAYSVRESSLSLQQQAENLLLSALGLEHWQPPEALTYERSAKDVFGAGRLDAEHFKPKFYDVWEKAQTVSGVSTVRLGEIIEPVKNGFDFRDFSDVGTPYIRVGDVKSLTIDTEGAAKVGISQADFSKNVNLQVGDILFTRKGSFGNAAVVRSGQEHSIISSEIMLTRIKPDNLSQILPDYLAIFLESKLGKLQSEQWAHGVAFYSITQADFENYRIPILNMDTQNLLTVKINESQAARNRSTQLLDLAKRAVEIAIEESEAAALAYLQAGGKYA